MNKLYYLSTCTTCKKIIKRWSLNNSIKLIDVKTNTISKTDLMELYNISNSFESLFNKRAQLLRIRKIKCNELSEEDFFNLILEHYSFLKRPILLYNNKVFIGNSESNIKSVEVELSKI